MSWSVNFTGKPEEVVKELEDHSTRISGQSKVEYDSALPHLIGLVSENFSNENSGIKININAFGHGYESGGKQTDRNCSVSLSLV